MAEPLKNQYGPDVPRRIASMIRAVHPAFPESAFLKQTLSGYEHLDLMARGRWMAEALKTHLPHDYPMAISILVRSAGPVLDSEKSFGMGPILYLPHVFFVARYGLDHFEESMQAQHALTQRFTAEFSIRPFLERHTDRTLRVLKAWARDPSMHVRRLVSEGTRPRLPWAPRLRNFQQDPGPVLALLEMLKDDPELYVRRSVANNLNDIGKDHPELLVNTAREWMKGANAARARLVRHALRSAVKRGDPAALAVLGFRDRPEVAITDTAIRPVRVRIGGSVTLYFGVKNLQSRPQKVLIDFRVHFIKANGSSRPRVFKLKTIELAPNETVPVQKSVSLKEMTTRQHYPGKHAVDVLVNGKPFSIGEFRLATG